MIQIAQVPYEKIYKFPNLSDAMVFKLLLYGLAIVLPFFLVFSVNNFYLTYTDTVTPSPSFKFKYKYYLTITTSESIYTYTNIYADVTSSRSISFSYENNQNQLTHVFTANWMKPAAQKVKKVSLIVLMSYSTKVSTGQGIMQASGTGYDLSDVQIIGNAKIIKGLNQYNSPPASVSNILIENNFNVGLTQLKLQQNYKTFLSSSTETLVFNLPNNLLKFAFVIKAPAVSLQQQSPSILGQLVWSFAQYFPVACVFWFISKQVLNFLFKEGVVKRIVIQDKF